MNYTNNQMECYQNQQPNESFFQEYKDYMTNQVE